MGRYYKTPKMSLPFTSISDINNNNNYTLVQVVVSDCYGDNGCFGRVRDGGVDDF